MRSFLQEPLVESQIPSPFAPNVRVFYNKIILQIFESIADGTWIELNRQKKIKVLFFSINKNELVVIWFFFSETHEFFARRGMRGP